MALITKAKIVHTVEFDGFCCRSSSFSFSSVTQGAGNSQGENKPTASFCQDSYKMKRL